jgi:hypothetical protein
VLLLAEGHTGYVASILSRRAGLPGLMWDLDNTPLPGTVPFLAGDRTSRIGVRVPQPPPIGACGPQAPNDRGRPVGHVCHDPRLSGPVGHKPQMTAHGAGPAATGHTANVASISRWRAELAGRLWDLPKTPLLEPLPLWRVSGECPIKYGHKSAGASNHRLPYIAIHCNTW